MIEQLYSSLNSFQPLIFHKTEPVKIFEINNHNLYLFDTQNAFDNELKYNNEIERGFHNGFYYIIDLVIN